MYAAAIRAPTEAEPWTTDCSRCPRTRPSAALYDGHQWDLQQLRWADELGFSEAWIGEHHTAPWEPHPAPDLLVAQALMQTKRMRIGPGGFLMPYHHPAELANRVAMLDHLAQGRLNFGVAASGLPSDWAMFNVDGMSGQHREMTREALEIILRLWGDEPEFDHKGKYWHVTKTGTMLDTLQPAHQAAPEAASADRRGRRQQGLRHAEAGRRARLLADEPEPEPGLRRQPLGVRRDRARRAAAARRSARTGGWCARSSWPTPTPRRMRLSVGGMMGRMMREYFLPLLAVVPVHRVPQAQARRAGLRRHARVLRAAQLAGGLAGHGDERGCTRSTSEVGGFGTLLLFCFDYSENPQAWRHSMELLAHEVMPKFKSLVPK